MNPESVTQDNRIDTYDRLLGSMNGGLPGVSSTKPSTVAVVMPLLGTSQTYIVQTFRSQQPDADGKPKAATFTVFLQYVEGSRAVKLALPARVSELIARQREALTKQAMKRRAKEQAATRMATSGPPTFGRKAG